MNNIIEVVVFLIALLPALINHVKAMVSYASNLWQWLQFFICIYFKYDITHTWLVKMIR